MAWQHFCFRSTKPACRWALRSKSCIISFNSAAILPNNHVIGQCNELKQIISHDDAAPFRGPPRCEFRKDVTEKDVTEKDRRRNARAHHSTEDVRRAVMRIKANQGRADVAQFANPASSVWPNPSPCLGLSSSSERAPLPTCGPRARHNSTSNWDTRRDSSLEVSEHL